MCDVTPVRSTPLAKSLSSPALARVFVEENVCPVHGARGVVAAQLLASELATNAVLYGAEPISLEISCSVYSMQVAVHDQNRTKAALQAMADGQGMLLVAKVAHTWGTTLTSTGKTVWGIVPTGFLPEQKPRTWSDDAVGRRSPDTVDR